MVAEAKRPSGKAGKQDQAPLDKRKLGMVVFSCVAFPLAAWLFSGLLPTFFPELYVKAAPSDSAPAPAAAATSTPSTRAAPPAANAEDAAELEKIAATEQTDPVGALRSLALLAQKSTAIAPKAMLAAERIKKNAKGAVDAANDAAAAELDALAKDAAPRLAELEHQAVIEQYRAIEKRIAGLPAAERAADERARVEAAWSSTPYPERAACDAFRALPANDPSDAKEALALAERCHALREEHTSTRYAGIAEARCERLLEMFTKAVETTREPEAALALAAQLPPSLRATQHASRIAAAEKRARADVERDAGMRVEKLRALRTRGDLDGAAALAAKLPPAQQAQEKAAIDLFARLAKSKIAVPAGDMLAGPEGALTRTRVGAFVIDAHEMTNRIYAVFARETQSAKLDVEDKDLELPVVNVTQKEALACARWLGGRLPTAIEWERAARGTDGRPYPWGRAWSDSALNWCSGVLRVPGAFGRGVSPVGCMDMAGNAAEWTATTDAKGLVAVKGGSRRDVDAAAFHVAAVVWMPSDKRDSVVGFRCTWDAAK